MVTYREEAYLPSHTEVTAPSTQPVLVLYGCPANPPAKVFAGVQRICGYDANDVLYYVIILSSGFSAVFNVGIKQVLSLPAPAHR
jgi:hypothetical protein